MENRGRNETPSAETEGTFHVSELTGQAIPVVMKISLLMKTIQPDQSNPIKDGFSKKKLWKKPISFANWLVRQWSCRSVLTNRKRLKPKESAAEEKFLARLAHPKNCTYNLIEQMEIQVTFPIFCFIYFANSLKLLVRWSAVSGYTYACWLTETKKTNKRTNKILKRNYFDYQGIKFKTPRSNIF